MTTDFATILTQTQQQADELEREINSLHTTLAQKAIEQEKAISNQKTKAQQDAQNVEASAQDYVSGADLNLEKINIGSIKFALEKLLKI